MDKAIEFLNKALSIEYSAVIQYCQHSALVQGTDRAVYEEFFNESSEEARGHAKLVSDWIVSLGGVPTIEAANIKQATSVVDMLQQDLETEMEALDTYFPGYILSQGKMIYPLNMATAELGELSCKLPHQPQSNHHPILPEYGRGATDRV